MCIIKHTYVCCTCLGVSVSASMNMSTRARACVCECPIPMVCNVFCLFDNNNECDDMVTEYGTNDIHIGHIHSTCTARGV